MWIDTRYIQPYDITNSIDLFKLATLQSPSTSGAIYNHAYFLSSSIFAEPGTEQTVARTLSLLRRARAMAQPSPTKPIKILMLHGFTQSGPLFRSKTRALEKKLQKAFPQGVTLVYPSAPIQLSHADIPTWDSPAGTSTSNSTSQQPQPNGNAETVSSAQADKDDELDAWSWWRLRERTEPPVYSEMEAGFARLAQVLQDAGGPFDGVIGFSQGAAMAALVASLLEDGRPEAFRRFEAVHGDGDVQAWARHAVRGEHYKDLVFEPAGYPACFLDGKNGKIHPPLRFCAAYSGFAAAKEEERVEDMDMPF